ncbi:uncharacterized protein LOC141907234 [Tubulanus polymorphus]|uniref:uncharacterized protein LOC141907234 n=1 Tax=Tubulanus polymorphus TaxID=672921 RepID=UPI003DA55B67
MAAFNKIHARKFLMKDGGGVRYTHLDVNASPQDISDAVKLVGLPAFIKPICLHDSIGVAKIKNENDIKPCLQIIEESKTRYRRNDFIGVGEIRPGEDGAILEEYIDSKAIASVEGCVANRNIIHWSITDTLFWPSRPSAVLGCTYPPPFSRALQNEIWHEFDDIVGRMIELGFDNQFVHVEMFIMADNSIKIIEINHRLSTVVAPLYRACLHDGNVGVALMEMNRGIIPKHPRPNGKCGLGGQVVTFKSDLAKDLIDFEYAKSIPDVVIIKSPNENVVYPGDDGGCFIGVVSAFGDNHQDAFKKFLRISRMILKQPEYSPSEITDGEGTSD